MRVLLMMLILSACSPSDSQKLDEAVSGDCYKTGEIMSYYEVIVEHRNVPYYITVQSDGNAIDVPLARFKKYSKTTKVECPEIITIDNQFIKVQTESGTFDEIHDQIIKNDKFKVIVRN